MPSSASPTIRSSGSSGPARSPESGPGSYPRLEAFQIDALLGCMPQERALQCTGWEADACVADIETADLVSLRFDPARELPSRQDLASQSSEAEAYYQACVASLDESLPIRLGLCCCRWQPSLGVWKLRSHEVGLFPGDLLEITKDAAASRFSAAATAFEAVPGGETALEAESKKSVSASRWSGQLASCSKWVVAALCAVQVPIVVHNGLLDLLHLSDKFFGQIPAGSLSLGHVLSRHFPIVFDTCLIVQDGLESPMEQARLRSLEEMYSKLLARQQHRKAHVRVKEFGMYTHRASSKAKGQVFGRGIGAAARDAMCIAEAFLLEMGHQICEESSARPKEGGKRLFTEQVASNGDMETPSPKVARKSTEPMRDATPRKSPKKRDAEEVGEFTRCVTPLEFSPCKRHQEKGLSLGAPSEAAPPGELWPSILGSHPLSVRFHNRVAALGVPCLYLKQSPFANSKGVEFNVHSLLRQLGAKEDSHGRPVVTRAMTKQLRRVLSQQKIQQDIKMGLVQPALA